MGVRTHGQGPRTLHRSVGPGLAAPTTVAALAFVLLVANGRPLGPPEEGGTAGTALHAALFAGGLVLDLDPTGRAVMGKALAALFAAVAAGLLLAGVGRRHALRDGRVAGLVLALGTSLAAAAQSWSGEAPATAAVALSLVFLVRADQDGDPAVAPRAAVPLAAAVALQPSTWVLASILVAAVLLRFPRSALRTLAWSVPSAAVAAAFVLGGGSALPRGEEGGPGPLALLVSPARGALAFTPVALVGLVGAVSAVRGRAHRLWDAHPVSPWLPLAALVAALGHVTWVAVLGDGSGPSWGPRLFAPAWPLLLLFLPEGMAFLRVAGVALVAVSVAIQALGALSWDGRWDRLYGPGGQSPRSPWRVLRSPLVFQLHERVIRPALVAVEGGRLVVREHPLRLGGPTGSWVAFAGDGTKVEGADSTLGDVLLEGGARVVEGRLQLHAPDDALFFRVREASRSRRLELRIRGRGAGTLRVEENTFHTSPRAREETVAGTWRVRLPYLYAESGGGDIRVRAGRGSLEVESVALVPPGEPESVIRLP